MQWLPVQWWSRLLVNAAILVVATLLAASALLARLPQVLIWLGALMVLLVHRFDAARPVAGDWKRWPNALRLTGVLCAAAGVALSFGL